MSGEIKGRKLLAILCASSAVTRRGPAFDFLMTLAGDLGVDPDDFDDERWWEIVRHVSLALDEFGFAMEERKGSE